MPDLDVGDFLVYPCQGVGQIIAIEKRSVGGQPTAFFTVRVLDTHADVLIPANRIHDSGVRPIVDATRADAILSVFDHPVDEPNGQSWIQRSRRYQSLLASGDALDVAVVFRDLFHMKLTDRLTFGQLQLFERSYRTTVFELAISLDTSPDTVERVILERLRRANGLVPSAA